MQLWSAKLGDLEELLEEKRKCCKRRCLAGGIPSQLLHDRRTDFVWTRGEQVHCLCEWLQMIYMQNLISCMFVHLNPSQVAKKRLLQFFLDAKSPTSFSFGRGDFPICWVALCLIAGCSTTLLQSVAGTPKARCGMWLVLIIICYVGHSNFANLACTLPA